MAARSERGFAAMDPKEQRAIASRGGRAAHESGNAHEFTSEEAAQAGRKGGEVVSRNREHMAEIGRKGGLAAHHRNAAFSHESATHHHRQTAQQHDDGELKENASANREAGTPRSQKTQTNAEREDTLEPGRPSPFASDEPGAEAEESDSEGINPPGRPMEL